MSTPTLTNEKKYNISLLAVAKDYAWKQAKRIAKLALTETGDVSKAHADAIQVYATICPALTESCRADLAWQAVMSVRGSVSSWPIPQHG